MKKFIFILFLLLALLPLCLQAQTPSAEEPVSTQQQEQKNEQDALAKQIQERFEAVQTLSSRFVQEKHLVLLTEPVMAKGSFSFSKLTKQLRWEYTEPFQNGFLLDGKKHYRLENGAKIEMKTMLARNIAAQMMMWLSFDLKTLSETYQVQYLETGVVLIPLSDKHALEKITVFFDEKNPQVLSQIRMDETNGDYTILRFEKTRINQPLAEGTFK